MRRGQLEFIVPAGKIDGVSRYSTAEAKHAISPDGAGFPTVCFQYTPLIFSTYLQTVLDDLREFFLGVCVCACARASPRALYTCILCVWRVVYKIHSLQNGKNIVMVTEKKWMRHN